MHISYLVPAFNAKATLAKAVQSILLQDTDCKKDILIIDDGSRDGTLRTAEQLKPLSADIRIVATKNGGEASAINCGLRQARGDFIAFVEADVELEKGWLRKLLYALDDPMVIGAGGTLITARSEPWIARIAGYEIEYKFSTKRHFTSHITSANALYKSIAFEKAGAMNESLMNASWDSDFNNRLIAKGYKLAYVRDAVVLHHYKAAFMHYLGRNFSYALYRIYVCNACLYPADRFLIFNVALSAVFIVSFFFIKIFIWAPVCFFVLLFIVHLPLTIKLWYLKKDPALAVYPAVAVIRNIVAVAGLTVGIAKKYSPVKKLVRTLQGQKKC